MSQNRYTVKPPHNKAGHLTADLRNSYAQCYFALLRER